ncbi:MAG: rhomboid family intramembrane serine protease [Porticoccaceae bacterium]|nr:rhomboid family intramembrane serine protease [Porticoccaceae bacterium]
MTTLNQNKWWLAAKSSPVVSLLMFGCAVGAIVVELSYPPPNYLFYNGLQQGQYLRLITPIFLHFGILHLVFNCLWLSLLGSRIEREEGSVHLLLLVAVSAAGSNMAQFNWSGSMYFGGMSGVIYALLGYLWIKHKMAPQSYPPLPNGLMGFMVGWLLLCMTGILEVALGIGVANAAHLSGLVIGLSIGLAFALMGVAQKQ